MKCDPIPIACIFGQDEENSDFQQILEFHDLYIYLYINL